MSISLKEIESLIPICASNGVEEIKFGELLIKFKTDKPQAPVPIPADQAGPIEYPKDVVDEIQEIEEQLNLMIENPDEYEEMLANSETHELEDAQESAGVTNA